MAILSSSCAVHDGHPRALTYPYVDLGGISLSPAFAIMYVMQHFGLPWDDALQYVQNRRYCISPNGGFLTQLKARRFFNRLSCIYSNILDATTCPSHQEWESIYRASKAVSTFPVASSVTSGESTATRSRRKRDDEEDEEENDERCVLKTSRPPSLRLTPCLQYTPLYYHRS